MKMLTIGLAICMIGGILMIFGASVLKGKKNSKIELEPNPIVVTAGCEQTIFLPGNVVELKGEIYCDSLHVPVSWLWTQISGPLSGFIEHPNYKSTLFKGLSVAGTYVLNFRAETQDGFKASQNVKITVKAFPYID